MSQAYWQGRMPPRQWHSGDFSVEGLWNYNLDFNKTYGKKTAGLEVFRVYLQSLNNDLINYGMKNFLSTKEAIDARLRQYHGAQPCVKVQDGAQGSAEHRRFLQSHICRKDDEGARNRFIRHYPKTPTVSRSGERLQTAAWMRLRQRFRPNPL